MQYTVNEVARKCVKKECECKWCTFNGIAGMCIGCCECVDHKFLLPVANCSILKNGDWEGFSVIKLNDRYFMSVPMAVAGVPEYFKITEEEYCSFNEWKNDNNSILEAQNR